jgi:hypothetical protein
MEQIKDALSAFSYAICSRIGIYYTFEDGLDGVLSRD